MRPLSGDGGEKVHLSAHCHKSFDDHLPVRPDKRLKVARKAWLSREPIPDKRRQKEREALARGSLLRLFMGCLFVFQEKHPGHFLLITLYPLRRGERMSDLL